MNERKWILTAAMLVAGTTLAIAGCGDRQSAETLGEKADRTTAKVAAATDRAISDAAMAAEDAAISTRVKSALFAEPGLSSLRIDVETKDGVVTLSGTVDSSALKDRAAQTAQQVSGVRSVVDHLTVKSTG